MDAFELRTVLFRGDIDAVRGDNVARKIAVVLILSGEIRNVMSKAPGTVMEKLDEAKNSRAGGGEFINDWFD